MVWWKSLWRGGPNTAKGAAYYWNVNKQSAYLLDEIRKAFTEGNQEKVERLTCQNFNSTVPYESYKEDPFRFGNFTTMGEFYIETGLSTIGISGYRRELSLDSARAIVQFCKDGVKYKRTSFISYPANVLVILDSVMLLIRFRQALYNLKGKMDWFFEPD